jgi:hypothetical protein
MVTTLEIGGKTSTTTATIAKPEFIKYRGLKTIIANNKEDRKPKTLCQERGRNSNKFYDINNLKPYITSVAVFLRGLGSVLYSWRYVGTVSLYTSQGLQRHSCQPATFLAANSAGMSHFRLQIF